MRGFLKTIICAFATAVFGSAHADGIIELSESSYKEYGENSALLILQINWGRRWGCGGYENAQIHKLSFRKILQNGQLSDETSFELESPSRLFVKNEFLPYAYIIKPGQYAMVGFDIKVAKSSTDVGHLIAKKSDLIKETKTVGGIFTAVENKATYIGHFGLDCYQQPIPWRYHIDGREEFKKYVEGFRKQFPFARDIPVSFNLFSTSRFGQPYSLDETSDLQ